MGLIEHLDVSRVHLGLEVENKDDLFSSLAELAHDRGVGESSTIVEHKLRERESTMSTGIGNGVGIPHTLMEGLDTLQAFLVTLKHPIPYDSIDGIDVSLIFLLFGNPDDPRTSLQALAVLGRIMRDRGFVEALVNTDKPEEILDMIKAREERRTDRT